VFAVSSGRGEMLGRTYFAGLVISPYIGWTLGTLLGAIAGNVLPSFITGALTIAIYAMLIAIVVPAMKNNRSTALAVFLAIALSVIFCYAPVLNEIPSGFTIVICAVAVSALFALIAPIKDEEDESEVGYGN
jgi:predicted branched-subunit amino acid permease